jgi:hypothetical protein
MLRKTIFKKRKKGSSVYRQASAGRFARDYNGVE